MGGIVSNSKQPSISAGAASVSASSSPQQQQPQHKKASDEIKSSWQAVKKVGADVIGMAIFEKLFERDPQTFDMFKTFRTDEQWRHSRPFQFHSKSFVNVIGSALVNVQSEEEIGTTMHTIGAAHSLFDIRNEHFDILGEELIAQVRIHLKEAFTPAVETAWREAYDHVTHTMKFSMQHGSSKY